MMELRQLRYLASLAREGQFTRAAARLNVAQPALSQQIRKLEDELGVALVDRTPHGARLTVAGERAVARARSVLAEVDALREEIGELAGLTGGRVAVGVTPTAGPVDVAAILGAFHRDRPAIELAVLERLSVELAEQLRGDTLDVAFVTQLDGRNLRGLELRQVATERLVAILAPRHELAARRRIRLADLRDEPFAIFHRGATIRTAVERLAAEAGFAPRTAFEVGDVARARALVAEGLAVAILPRSDAERPGPPIAAVALAGRGLGFEVFLAWRRDLRQAPATRAFIEHVVSHPS
jgi:DNA-binding transcriptional LysR family regulator